MKRALFTTLSLAAVTILTAQSSFFTRTCYRGAFAPAPTPMWTDNWTEWDPQNEAYGAPTSTVAGNVTGNANWSGIVLLQGPVYVTNNAVLTIQPGTIVRASKSVAGSALIITRGAQLHAEGTATAPIVFTSDQAAGSRALGDWGGIVLLGRATNNYTSGVNYVEGLPQTANAEHGAAPGQFIDSDNSGTLKYVRIEFGGYQYQPNQEINGLTMGSVGRGTSIEHVQVSFVNDDGFEWFGGTVNARWLVSYRNLDDDFDTDNGYSGNVQFALAVRDPNLADNPAVSTSEGFESDNNAAGTALTPFTSAIFSNVTLVGPYRGASTATVAAGYRRALRIRRASQLKIYNSIFMDTQRGLHIDGTLSEQAATAGNLKFRNNIIAGTQSGRITEVNSGSTFNNPAFFGSSLNDSIPYNSSLFTGLLVSPYSYTSPDYRPGHSSAALDNAGFTDAAIAAQTGSSSSAAATSVAGGSIVCLGQPGSIGTHTFVTANTNLGHYCSVHWSVSPGLAVSSSTAANPTFTVSTVGTFTVYLTVNNGGGAQTAMASITTHTCMDVAVARHNLAEKRISLAPNPAKDVSVVTIQSPQSQTVTVSVLDIAGKQVAAQVNDLSLAAGQSDVSIHLDGLNSGVYFVVVKGLHGTETLKLIVNR